MMTNSLTHIYKPDYAVHPGEYLEEVLESREIKKTDLANRLGISEKHLSQIINKKALISAELSLLLEKTLGISADIWNNMNADYALFEARQKETDGLKANADWVKKFPVSDLKKLGFLPDIRSHKDLVEPLLHFFSISSPGQWDTYYGKAENVSFRKSDAFTDNLAHIASWLRVGELQADKIETVEYSKEIFKTNLNKIRDLTTHSPETFEPEMTRLCAEAGVALTFVPEFDKTHLSGATKWLTQNKALIIMSLRHRTNDHFWFTFFHEAGHILLHGKKEIFIDTKTAGTSQEEEEANKYSRTILIPENEYKKFSKKAKIYESDIVSFAEEIGIHPGIVVGRLQHDSVIDYKWHNKLKETFEFKLPEASKN